MIIEINIEVALFVNLYNTASSVGLNRALKLILVISFKTSPHVGIVVVFISRTQTNALYYFPVGSVNILWVYFKNTKPEPCFTGFCSGNTLRGDKANGV